MAVTDIIDNKICRIPKAFNGDKTKWKHFRVSLLGFVGGVNQEPKQMMKTIEEVDEPTTQAGLGMNQRMIELDAKVGVILTNVFEDGSTAMDFMCNVPEGSGLEV